MKKKITLIALMLLLVTSLMVLFAFSVSAEGEIEVKYINNSGTTKEVINPNADGTYTLKATGFSKNGKFTFKDGTVVNKEFFGWFDLEGNIYAPGETVAFTKNTQIKEAYGVVVNNLTEFIEIMDKQQDYTFIRLNTDIETTSTIGSGWDTTMIDLNGHTLTIKQNNDKKYAVGISRGSFMLVGKGKVVHNHEKLNTTDNNYSFCQFTYSGYASDSNPQFFVVGKDVEIVTPYYLVRIDQAIVGGPKMYVSGKVSAKGIIRTAAQLNSAIIEITESAKLELSGTDMFNFGNETSSDLYATITILGSITLTNPDAVLFDDFVMSNRFAINKITSGTYVFGANDAERLALNIPETHMLKTVTDDNGNTYYTVTLTDCVHNWIKDEEASVKATLGATGTDVFNCTLCKRQKVVITSYDPSNVQITITVVDENGVVSEFTVNAGDVIEFGTTGIGASIETTFERLKDFTVGGVAYTKNNIVKLSIPAGVSKIEAGAIDSLASLKEIIFEEKTNIVLFANTVSNCPALEKVVLENANVRFVAGKGEAAETNFFANCPSLTTLDVSTSDAVFENYSFASNKTINYLLLGEGKTYRFGQYCFAHSQLKEVILPDNSSITLEKKCFAETTSIEYIYVGANCIANKRFADESSLFGGNAVLSKVVLMDIEYIGRWVLSVKTSGDYVSKNDLYVYIHSENVTFENASFNDRKSHMCYIYTAATEVTGVPGTANYVIYKGIGHKYTEDVITESTCVTQGTFGYTTDCPCGIDYRTNGFTTVSNKVSDLNEKTHEAYGTEIGYLPLKEEHTVSDIVCNIDFVNGMTEMGIKCYKCLYCDEISTKEETASFPAIFKTMGYSYAQANDKYGVMQGFAVNKDVLNEYEEITSSSVLYGLCAGTVNKLGENADLVNPDGSAVSGAVSVSYNDKKFDIFEMKISGLTDAHKDTELYICAYYVVNGKAYYISGGVSNLEKPTTISYNKIVNA